MRINPVRISSSRLECGLDAPPPLNGHARCFRRIHTAAMSQGAHLEIARAGQRLVQVRRCSGPPAAQAKRLSGASAAVVRMPRGAGHRSSSRCSEAGNSAEPAENIATTAPATDAREMRIGCAGAVSRRRYRCDSPRRKAETGLVAKMLSAPMGCHRCIKTRKKAARAFGRAGWQAPSSVHPPVGRHARRRSGAHRCSQRTFSRSGPACGQA